MRLERWTGGVAVLAMTVAATMWVFSERAVRPDARLNASGQPLPLGVETAGWDLVFFDEFTGDRLDGDRWVTCYWWEDDGCTNLGSENAQWYLPSALSVAGGHLRIEATEDPAMGVNGRRFPYTSGIVTTGRLVDDLNVPPRFAFTYGWAEIRARAPAGRGLWSAFWLLPTSHESKPEMDVVEILGHRPDVFEAHVHYREGGRDRSRGQDWAGPDFSDAFHVFGLRWSEDRLEWYVDGIRRWAVDDPRLVPREPMYLLLNLAVGGEWPGYPDESTTFPAHLLVDYVRVWQPAGATS